MSDLIFKTKGKETFRIPFPTPGTKCPETKLEIKMTETDISKVLIEGEYATIMGVKYKRVEEQVKFTHITRVIGPKSGIHYLDAIDENGQHWMAQMSHGIESWLVYTDTWKKDPQQPYNYD